MLVCSFAHAFVRSFFRSFVRSFASLFVWLVALFLRDSLVGNATARVIRNRIYEATGGQGSEKVSRKEGPRRPQGALEPKRPWEARIEPRRPWGTKIGTGCPRRPKCSPGGPLRQESSPGGPKSSESSPRGPSTLIDIPLSCNGGESAAGRVKTMP